MNSFKNFWRYYRQSKVAVVALVLLLALLGIALFAHRIAPFPYDAQNPALRFQSPGAQHWMGTDNFGRDIFSRILYGARISLEIGFISVGVAMCLGVILGSLAGYFQGPFDALVMRLMDTILSIPQLILAIALAAALGNGMRNLILAVALSAVPRYARIVRSSVIHIKDNEYIEAARMTGSSHLQIIFSEILPNCLAPIIVEGTIGVGTSILSAASLSFIGMGIMPPYPEWGQMLSEGRAYIRDYPFMTLFPGLSIACTILLLNVVGDGLRDAFDPKFRR